MTTKFLEPGGDSTFNVATTTAGGFWGTINGGANSIVTDFVHGSHIKSIAISPGSFHNSSITAPVGSVAGSASRVSFYIYFVAFPAATARFSTNDINTWGIRLTSSGVVQLQTGSGGGASQIGSDGPTLVTGNWYRISLAYTISSSSVNRFELFINSVSKISVTNATLSGTAANQLILGNSESDTTLDIRVSDIYTDDSSSLTDMGDVWVTAKRPNANGTLNQFTTQIGAGGSGYGTGHSPQVNERALSTTNGWNGASGQVEEYTIESQSTGDIDISSKSIVDFGGWVYASADSSRTCSLILNGVSSNISVTTTQTMFTSFAGQTIYPITGTDIGMSYPVAPGSGNLYECGVMVAYLQNAPSTGIKRPAANNLRPRIFGPGLAR